MPNAMQEALELVQKRIAELMQQRDALNKEIKEAEALCKGLANTIELFKETVPQ